MYINLTHVLKSDITVYPGTIPPKFEPGNTIEKDGFAELNITMCTHTGTHIDAPAHIIESAPTLDSYPMDKFIGKGFVIDCRNLHSIERDFLQSWEQEIRRSDFLLFYSGWQDKWNTESYFEPFPVLTQEAAEWLTGFHLKALGFDVISVDKMDDHHLPNHHILLPKEILIIENMANLHFLLDKAFELYVIPLYIGKADGSPVRAFARLL